VSAFMAGCEGVYLHKDISFSLGPIGASFELTINPNGTPIISLEGSLDAFGMSVSAYMSLSMVNPSGLKWEEVGEAPPPGGGKEITGVGGLKQAIRATKLSQCDPESRRGCEVEITSAQFPSSIVTFEESREDGMTVNDYVNVDGVYFKPSDGVAEFAMGFSLDAKEINLGLGGSCSSNAVAVGGRPVCKSLNGCTWRQNTHDCSTGRRVGQRIADTSLGCSAGAASECYFEPTIKSCAGKTMTGCNLKSLQGCRWAPQAKSCSGLSYTSCNLKSRCACRGKKWFKCRRGCHGTYYDPFVGSCHGTYASITDGKCMGTFEDETRLWDGTCSGEWVGFSLGTLSFGFSGDVHLGGAGWGVGFKLSLEVRWSDGVHKLGIRDGKFEVTFDVETTASGDLKIEFELNMFEGRKILGMDAGDIDLGFCLLRTSSGRLKKC